MYKRVQIFDKNGEVIADNTTAVNDALTEEGYRFPAHKAGARIFSNVQFPKDMSDSDIGKMTKLSKCMIGDTNALGYHSGKKIYPYLEEKICELVGIKSKKRGRQFLRRMLDLRMMKKKVLQDGCVYYVINPAYFMASGRRLTCSLFIEFQQELEPLLPERVLTWFLRQAKGKQV